MNGIFILSCWILKVFTVAITINICWLITIIYCSIYLELNTVYIDWLNDVVKCNYFKLKHFPTCVFPESPRCYCSWKGGVWQPWSWPQFCPLHLRYSGLCQPYQVTSIVHVFVCVHACIHACESKTAWLSSWVLSWWTMTVAQCQLDLFCDLCVCLGETSECRTITGSVMCIS